MESTLQQIGQICERAISANGIVCNFLDDDCTELSLQLGNDDVKVIVDEFDLEEDDEPNDAPWAGMEGKRVEDLGKAELHAELLHVMLVGLARSGLQITDMSIDGDHKDCEAVFAVDGNYFIVKVR